MQDSELGLASGATVQDIHQHETTGQQVVNEVPITVNKGLVYPPSESEHNGILVTSNMCLRLNCLERDLAPDWRKSGRQNVNAP